MHYFYNLPFASGGLPLYPNQGSPWTPPLGDFRLQTPNSPPEKDPVGAYAVYVIAATLALHCRASKMPLSVVFFHSVLTVLGF